MRKRCYVLPCCALVMVLVVVWACRHRRPQELPVAALDEVGLHWNECAVSAPYTWAQAEECFSHPMPLSRQGEQSR